MLIETAHALQVRERAVEHERSEGERATPDGAVWVGVTRSPPAWFRRRVDDTEPVLGLPAEVAATLNRRRQDLQMQGLCAEGAHNAAWAEVEVDDRYRAHLSTDEARRALDTLVTEGRDLVLATDRRPGFRCHRTVLASVLGEE